MKIQIKTNAGVVEKKLKGINERRLNAWVGFALREEAEEFSDTVRKQWLSGYAFERRTGTLADHVLPWTRKKDNAVLVRPGVKVPGSSNWLGRWAGHPKRDFMQKAFKQFSANGRIAQAVEENIDEQLEKAMKK